MLGDELVKESQAEHIAGHSETCGSGVDRCAEGRSHTQGDHGLATDFVRVVLKLS